MLSTPDTVHSLVVAGILVITHIVALGMQKIFQFKLYVLELLLHLGYTGRVWSASAVVIMSPRGRGNNLSPTLGQSLFISLYKFLPRYFDVVMVCCSSVTQLQRRLYDSCGLLIVK